MNNLEDPMGFFFNDPNIKRMAPEDMRFEEIQVEPYPDGKRLHVTIKVTPFEKRPAMEIVLLDTQERELSAVNVIEPMRWQIDFVMHIRQRYEDQSPPYALKARLYYPPETEDGEIYEADTYEMQVDPAPQP